MLSSFELKKNKNLYVNIIWLILDKVFRHGLGLVSLIIVAKYLGPSDFGALSYALSFVGILLAFSMFGVQKIIVKEIVKDSTKAPLVIGSALVSIVSISLLLWVMSICLIFYLRPEDHTAHIMIAILGCTYVLNAFKVTTFHFEADVNHKSVILVSNIAFFLSTIYKLGLVYYKRPVVEFVGPLVLDGFLVAMLYLIIYNRAYSIKMLKAKFSTMKSLLKESFPLALAVLSVKLYVDIDQIMIREFIGDYDTGIYSMAVQLSLVWMFIPSAVLTVVYPSLEKLNLSNHENFINAFKLINQRLVLISFGIIIMVLLFGKFFIHIIFGPEYSNSWAYLKILIFQVLFSSLGGARTLFLISENNTKVYLATVIIGAITNIGLNFVLIPQYGAMAACWTTLFTTFFAGIGLNFFFPTLREVGKIQLKAILLPNFRN